MTFIRRVPVWVRLACVFVIVAVVAAVIVTQLQGGTPALSAASGPGPTSSAPASAAKAVSGLAAGCQMGEDNGGFAAVSQQDVTDDAPAYQVTVENNTGSAVTVTGFITNFDAYGSQVFTDNSPVDDPALIEPGEKWTFPADLTGSGFPQVSDTTYLEMTCTASSVLTASGSITPAQIGEPDGNQVSRAQDIAQAQSQLATDVSTLQSDSASLNSDDTLAQAVSQMKTDYANEQQEYQTEQGDAGTCGVSGDASAVGGDASAVGGDLSALNGAVNYLQQNGVAAVTSDLSTVAGDLTALKNYGTAPGTSTSAAVATGNAALASAASAIKWANGQGSTINGEAQSLAATAQNYANSHPCD